MFEVTVKNMTNKRMNKWMEHLGFFSWIILFLIKIIYSLFNTSSEDQYRRRREEGGGRREEGGGRREEGGGRREEGGGRREEGGGRR